MGLRKGHDPNWEEPRCPIEYAIGVIGGMWKVIIIRELLSGVKRYGQLHRALAGVTHKMLTQQLRELEADGLVKRTVYPVVPPKVEYELTPLGTNLEPILMAINEWGVELRRYRQAQQVGKPTET
jgi:DNA-binding HxlR family transcriptional regulator